MLKHIRFLTFIVFTAIAATGVTAGLRSSETNPQVPAKCEKACLEAKIDRHLMLMGEFGKDDAIEASQRELLAGGPAVIRAIEDTYNRWSRPESLNPKGNARPADMRWRALHLLGNSNSKEAIPFLYDVAKRPMPEPKASESEYADEYRMALRAIDGLSKLKAIDELKDLHEIGGVLSNPTAVALYENGVNVGGVKFIDANKALAQPTRRPDTPALTRQR